MDILDKIKYAFLFKEVTDEDNHGDPQVTIGLIVWGILLRSTIVVLITFFMLSSLQQRELWYFALFIIWLFALYPGWQQYKKYQKRMEEFQENTLCGSCRNFVPDSQLCKLYDEHVSTNHIPCEGLEWEPKY